MPRANTGDGAVFKQFVPLEYIAYIHGADMELAVMVPGTLCSSPGTEHSYFPS